MAQTWAPHGPPNWFFLNFGAWVQGYFMPNLPKGKGGAKNIPRMSPKKFRKITIPYQEIHLYWPNLSKKVIQLTELQTYRKFKIIQN